MPKAFHITPIGEKKILLKPGLSLDPSKPEILCLEILEALQGYRAKHLFYDLSGIAIIDTLYYSWLCFLSKACKASAISMTVIRMQAAAASTLALITDSKPPFNCTRDIEEICK